MLDPRAIALQGVGFAPALLAAQGFRPLADEPPVQIFPGSGRQPGKKRRRDGDDDVLMFLLR